MRLIIMSRSGCYKNMMRGRGSARINQRASNANAVAQTTELSYMISVLRFSLGGLALAKSTAAFTSAPFA
jgi:hypothetical protein